MTPGTYCVPRNRQEWEAILRLADSLGLLWQPLVVLALNESTFKGYGAISFIDKMGFVKPVPVIECKGEPFYIPEFVVGMYAEKDLREGKAKREAAPMNYSSGFMDASAGPRPLKAPHVNVQGPDPNTGIPDKAEKAASEVYLNNITSADINKRLKNLEEAFDLHLQEHRKAMMEPIIRIDGKPWYPVLEKKEAVAESAAGPSRSAKVLEDGMVTLTYSGDHRFDTHPSGAVVIIDPKASPTNIPFEIALAYLKAGRGVRRDKWDPHTRIEPRGPEVVGDLRMIVGDTDTGEVLIQQANLLATDWMVLPE